MPSRSALHQLAQAVGLARNYVRQDGEQVCVPDGALRAILAGLELDAGNEERARATHDDLMRQRTNALPPFVVTTPQAPIEIRLNNINAAHLDWRLLREDGSHVEGRARIIHHKDHAALSLPAQSEGYHRLEACGSNSILIVAPEKCWMPDAFAQGAKGWGVSAQIYGLSSARDFGVGGFAEVSALAKATGALGASFLGLSPTHALFTADREKHSPYSPSNRLLLEPLFIDPRQAPGFAQCAANQLLSDEDFKRRNALARKQQLIDYPMVWDLIQDMLQSTWEHFKRCPPDDDFTKFRQEGGETLERHAMFEALSERFAMQGLTKKGAWPKAFHDVRSRAVQEAYADLSDRLAYHAWLQWIAERQLADAAHVAHRAGMEIGLYRDLAVGADPTGSEIWSDPDHYALRLSIGAPPDLLAPQGQNWRLPPLNPLGLANSGLLRFRQLLAANMRHAGALRIDHAFQMARLFLIPEGCDPKDGAYMRYPFEAMLACVRLESHRARCLVMGEDLGTAPQGFSDALMRSAMLSNRVFIFTRKPDNTFSAPEEYPRHAMASVTTHDLPTFAGWWRGLDIDLRSYFGLTNPNLREEELRIRNDDREKLCAALGCTTFDCDPNARPPYLPVIRYLARTTSMQLALQAEDLSGDVHQANVPGPSVGHPNWRRRLAMDVDTLCAPGGLLARSAIVMCEEGRGLRAPAGRLNAPPPRATYRLQLRKTFTLFDAAKLAPYLAKLGVSHVYASPIQAARSGSPHGYDIVDYARINDELGGEAGFEHFTQALRDNGLKLLLDIVPNHMGVGGAENRWWLSVLEWGVNSPHAHTFDIDWNHPAAHGKLVLPFLRKPYGQALLDGELKLRFDPDEGSFSVWHWEHSFPINPLDYRYPIEWAVVAGGATEHMRSLRTFSNELYELMDALPASPHQGHIRHCEHLKESLARAARNSPHIAKALECAITYANGKIGVNDSFGPLHRLIDHQAYRLASWRVANFEINYRRFFDIISMAGIRVEDNDVFEATHGLILRLVAEGVIHGLRIDHVDGLAMPEDYLARLQTRTGPGFYIIAEKILMPGEDLRPWTIAGTNGYDAMHLLDAVFTNVANQSAFDAAYEEVTGASANYDDILRQTKLELIKTSFSSELESVVAVGKRAAELDILTRDITEESIKQALAEIIAALPVYRTYLSDVAPDVEDQHLIEMAVADAKATTKLEDTFAHDVLEALILETPCRDRSPTRHEVLNRLKRQFQQMSGPVMAKSFEDTLFYRYGRFVALNEVGGDPSRFGVTPRVFHALARERAAHWPASLSASATHDMKRGEDTRARLLALSHDPQTWRKIVIAADINNDANREETNNRYIALQTIMGAWPADEVTGALLAPDETFRARIHACLRKALREAKQRTTWTRPDEAYEATLCAWADTLFLETGAFYKYIADALPRIVQAGFEVSLARTALKLTIPGVPDIYQGCEFADFSLVDPDNRRPVDYVARKISIDKPGPQADISTQKQALIAALLRDRAHAPLLYASGNYDSVEAPAGWLSFRRAHNDERLLVTVRIHPFHAEPLSRDWICPAGQWSNLIRTNAFPNEDRARAPPVLILRSSS